MTKLYELEIYLSKTQATLEDAIGQAEGWSNSFKLNSLGGEVWPAMETLLKNLNAALELIKMPPEIINVLRDEADLDEAMRAGFDAEPDGYSLADFCGEHPTNWKHDPWGRGLYQESNRPDGGE